MNRMMSISQVVGVTVVVMLSGCAGTEVERIVADVTVGDKPADVVIVRFWPKDNLYLGCYQGLVRDGRFDIVPNKRRSKHPGHFGVYFQVPPTSIHMLARGVRPTPLPSKYCQEKAPLFEVELHPGVNELPPFELHWPPGETPPQEQAMDVDPELLKMLQKGPPDDDEQ